MGGKQSSCAVHVDLEFVASLASPIPGEGFSRLSRKREGSILVTAPVYGSCIGKQTTSFTCGKLNEHEGVVFTGHKILA